MTKSDFKTHIISILQNFIKEQKWLIFIFVLWTITFLTVTDQILPSSRTITVTGSSVNSVMNEVATFNLYISSKNADKLVAIDETNAKSSTIVDALKNFGLPEKDIQVANMSINREINYVNGVSKEGDWLVSVNINVTLYDMTKVNDLTTLMSGLDTSNFYGPNFSTNTVNVDETDLLQAAIKDATDKAGKIAKNLNAKLGRVVYVSEAQASTGYFGARMMDARGGGGAEMLPGSSDVYKSVTVTFEIL